jgi:hypothetical protein
MRYLLLLSILLVLCCCTEGQERASSKNSDLVITIDPTINGSISLPFDKRFTLSLLKMNTEKVKFIYLFESELINGERRLKTDYTIKNPNDSSIKLVSVFDYNAPFAIAKDTLNIYFPPLKPSRKIDVAIVRRLTRKNLEQALKLNEAISSGDSTSAGTEFTKLSDAASDPIFPVTFFTITDLNSYWQFFNSSLKSKYDSLQNQGYFPSTALLSGTIITQIQTALLLNKISFEDLGFALRALPDSIAKKIFKGVLPINYLANTKETGENNYSERLKNFQGSITYFDSLNKSLYKLLAIGYSDRLDDARIAVENIITRLKNNSSVIQTNFEKILQAMSEKAGLNELELFIGNTDAKDLKTKGGNIFTLDLGMANIVAANRMDKATYIPKPYYGLNIYFRPIDKNTRQESLPKKLNADKKQGPDYNILSTRSVWQRLCLTIGFTMGGGGQNKEFDNFFNNTMLLLGPGYRFADAFKVSAGGAFLKRYSKDPTIAEKKVGVGGYLSFSIDIDMVQGIKDITTIIFK